MDNIWVNMIKHFTDIPSPILHSSALYMSINLYKQKLCTTSGGSNMVLWKSTKLTSMILPAISKFLIAMVDCQFWWTNDQWWIWNQSENTSCNNILYINICYDLFVRQTWARPYPANHLWDGSWGWWRICQLVLGRPSPTWVMKNTAESGQAQGLDFETVDPLQVFQGCSKRGFAFRICILAAKNRNASSFSPNFAAQIWFLTVNWKTKETKKFAKDATSLVSLPNEISMV